MVTLAPRFFLPTGRSKPPATGFGKPDRFDRLLVKTGQIQIGQFKRFGPVSRPVWHSNLGLEKKLAAREPARARSGSRAWNEPSRASFLGSLKYRAEPARSGSRGGSRAEPPMDHLSIVM